MARMCRWCGGEYRGLACPCRKAAARLREAEARARERAGGNGRVGEDASCNHCDTGKDAAGPDGERAILTVLGDGSDV
jgi:hypothetical protein